MSRKTKQLLFQVSSIFIIASMLAACAQATTPPPTPVPATAAPTASAMDQLVTAAKGEGNLTVIALPHDWCNYGEALTGFTAKYGIKINELNPDAGSGDEVEAIKANKGNTGPQAPDVIDVGLSFGPQVISNSLVIPYKVSTWDTIPADQKDPNGYWYGDYYGILAFEVNKDVVKDVPSGLVRPAQARI